MPIRREMRFFYPIDWPQLSHTVRFRIAKGLCQTCRRPHGVTITSLPDGRWNAPDAPHWYDDRGRRARRPDAAELTLAKSWRVVLATAHMDQDPSNNAMENLRALCQRCHMLHDMPHHIAARRLVYRRRYALGDLFEGPYRRF